MTKQATWRVALLGLAVVLGGAACKSQTEQQKKVDELQAQLDEMKKQIAEKDAAATQAEAPPPQAETAPSPAPTTAAPVSTRSQPPQAAAAARQEQPPKTSTAGPISKKPSYVTTEQGQQAATQYQADKAKAKEAIERQQALNVQQAATNQQQVQTNQQIQQQIQDLKSRDYTIPAGTVIPIRTTSELSSSKLSNGSVFEALLERSLEVEGTTLAQQGARVTGVVVTSDPGGRIKGVADLVVTIRQIAGVRDQTIRVTTSSYSTEAQSTKGKDAKRTGIMTGIGAAIGAIAGGGKGAAIGAGAGAAAGLGTNAATRGEAAVIPAETVIEFKLTAPANVVVRQ